MSRNLEFLQKNAPTSAGAQNWGLVSPHFLRNCRNHFRCSRNYSDFHRCKDLCSKASGGGKTPAKSHPGSFPGRGSRFHCGRSKGGGKRRSYPFCRRCRCRGRNPDLRWIRNRSGGEDRNSRNGNRRSHEMGRWNRKHSSPHPGSAPRRCRDRPRSHFSGSGDLDSSSNRRRP